MSDTENYDDKNLTTKRGRIIHNERIKFYSTICLGGVIASWFGAGYTVMLAAEDTSQMTFAEMWLSKTGTTLLMLVALGIGLMRIGRLTLSCLIDPDDLPKPKRRTRKKKQP